MLRSIGIQSGVFVESFAKKKRKATVGRKAMLISGLRRFF